MKVALVCLSLGVFVGAVQAVPHWSRVHDILLPSWTREQINMIKRDEHGEEFDVCMQPVDAGMCRAAFPQFYYDAATGTCQEFYYGGCGGNLNRFDSLSECEQTCVQSPDLSDKRFLMPIKKNDALEEKQVEIRDLDKKILGSLLSMLLKREGTEEDLEKKSWPPKNIWPPMFFPLKRGGVGSDLGEKLGHGSQRYGSRHSWAEP